MLSNTAYRLRNNLGLTVAYFGGSITEGAGASSYEACWAAKTTAWLRSEYPDCPIRHIQAAVGGTDSTLGVCRIGRDVLARHPDLVFFEFAVNDSGMGVSIFPNSLKNAEACFRKIWAADPNTDIVTVYTVTQSLADRMAQGIVQPAKTAHAAVSYRYGVPQIDMGESLRTRVLTEGGDWLRYTTDTVHPNDDGYEICAAAVRERMKEWLSAPADGLTPHSLPSPLIPEEESRVNAGMRDCTEAESDGSWTLNEKSLCGRHPHYIECSDPGGELTLAFEGRQIGFYWMMAKDSGDALCSVDGGPFRTIRAWDHYCKSFSRANAAWYPDELTPGRHTLRLRVSPDKAAESEGTALRIGAFLVM